MKRTPTTHQSVDSVTLEFDRICDSIECLREIIPQTLNKALIKEIYAKAAYNSHIKQHEQYSKSEDFKNDEVELSEQERRALQELIAKQTAIAARAFCLSGYDWAGVQTACKRDSQQLRAIENKYEEIASRVVAEAVSLLEQYLVKERMLEKPSECREMRAIVNTAMHCRTMVAPEICDILFKIVRGLHEIDPPAAVTREEAAILYNTLTRLAKAKLDSTPPRWRKTAEVVANVEECRRKRKEFKYELHEKWRPQHEQLLLELYSQTPYISLIRDHFCLAFSEQAPLFTVPSLKSVLYRLLRTAIKRLERRAQEEGVQQVCPLTRLDDNRVKMIIYNEHFREARLLVLAAYANAHRRLLLKAITTINHLLSLHKNNYATRDTHDHSRRKLSELYRNFPPIKPRRENHYNYNDWSRHRLELKGDRPNHVRHGQSEPGATPD